MKLFWISILVLFLSFSPAFASVNLLKNSQFDDGLKNNIPLHWGDEYYNSSIVKGYSGNAVKIDNKKPAMSLAAQTVPLPSGAKKVSLSAYVKAENVVEGVETWNKMNIQVLFFDKAGVQLGGWPEIGPWTGSFDWKFVGKQFYIPKGAVSTKVVFGLYNASGIAYFDDVRLEITTPTEDEYNLVENGGFEIWEDWAYGGSEKWEIVFPPNVQAGVGALYINNKTPIWSFASQSIPIDGTKIKKINVEAYAKSRNVVQGVKPWQKARINLEFKDNKGKRIGGWPIVGEFTGTIGSWQKFSGTFPVPPETVRVDIFAGLLECVGEVWFDSIRVEAFTSSGEKVKKGGVSVTAKDKWCRFNPTVDPFSDSTFDLSYLLDAPAGKKGFLKVKGDHFYFEDGSRARFWGTNLYPPMTFPSKEDAEYVAKRLAKAGCNLVRIHHLDAFWADPNIFDPKFNDTQHINKETLDKLDYLLYQLKKNGIYIFFDLLVDRKFKEGDKVADWQNVERGAKFAGFYNKRIIELQKKYAEQILTHKNPYTGLRYVDDPAIVSYKLINEAMLYYIGTQFGLSKTHLAELDSLWNKWLLSKYGGSAGIEKAWTDKYGRCDLSNGESPSNNTVRRADTPLQYQRGGAEKVEPCREQDTMKFYYDLQVKYFKEMNSYLKSLGCRVPVSGSNHWVNVAADVKANASMDYIDRHRYWDHPQFGYGTRVVFENQAMVKQPKEALPNNFAFYRVAGKPFVISEWNSCFPNEYRAEGPLMMAAYANHQDWDAVLIFSFNHAGWTAPMQDNFDLSQWPNVLMSWQSAALLFHRQDVKQAKYDFKQTLGDKDLFGKIYEDSPIAEEPLLPLISKTQIDFAKEGSASATEGYVNQFTSADKKIIKSDTGELKIDSIKGVFTINTGRTQAAVGFLKGESVKLNDVAFSSDTGFAALSLSSLDNAPISSSRRMVLTAGARIENNGQKFSDSRAQLKEVGEAPILVEGVDAKISLDRAPRAIYALDVNGARKASIPSSGTSFKINSFDQAFAYELVF